MKRHIFFDSFRFNAYVWDKYRYTDNRGGSPYHYLACMEKGRCKIVSDGITITAGPGDVFYIPEGLPYQSYWFSDDEIRFRSLGFHYFPESAHKEFLLQKLDCSDAIRQALLAVPTGKSADSQVLGAFYSVWAQILPLLKCSSTHAGKAVVEKAAAYIYQHTDCKVGDVAGHCHISESALYHIFKKDAGCTPNEMIQKIRTDKAVLLLTTTSRSVGQISDDLNFSSPSYFRKVLRHYTGKTPRQIRKTAEDT